MKTLARFLPILALSGLLSTIQVAAILRTGGPSTGFLVDHAPGLFLLAWMIGDARRRRCVPCHEFGFLAGIFLPVALAWYLFWSRGWRGIGPLLAFAGLLLLPGVASVVTYSILYRE